MGYSGLDGGVVGGLGATGLWRCSAFPELHVFPPFNPAKFIGSWLCGCGRRVPGCPLWYHPLSPAPLKPSMDPTRCCGDMSKWETDAWRRRTSPILPSWYCSNHRWMGPPPQSPTSTSYIFGPLDPADSPGHPYLRPKVYSHGTLGVKAE